MQDSTGHAPAEIDWLERRLQSLSSDRALHLAPVPPRFPHLLTRDPPPSNSSESFSSVRALSSNSCSRSSLLRCSGCVKVTMKERKVVSNLYQDRFRGRNLSPKKMKNPYIFLCVTFIIILGESKDELMIYGGVNVGG